MALNRPTDKALRAARDRFRELLSRDDTPESEFQRLFSDSPFVLSEALPLKLNPADILPQGVPGMPGADFIIYPQARPIVYGAIELKRPDTTIITIPRKEIIVLSRDSATALAQAKQTAAQLKRQVEGSLPICSIGNNEYLFLIIGLATELRAKVATDDLRRQLDGLLPVGTTLLPYDTLLQRYERSVPRATYLVTPTRPWRPIRTPSWHLAAQACVEFITRNQSPDSPDITHVQDALRVAGFDSDHTFAMELLLQLLRDGVIAERDSTVPPWETLYWVRDGVRREQEWYAEPY